MELAPIMAYFAWPCSGLTLQEFGSDWTYHTFMCLTSSLKSPFFMCVCVCVLYNLKNQKRCYIIKFSKSERLKKKYKKGQSVLKVM